MECGWRLLSDGFADFFVFQSHLFVEFVTLEESIIRNRPDGGKIVHVFRRQSDRSGDDLRDGFSMK